MNRLREHRKLLIFLTAALLLAGLWYVFWLRISTAMTQAQTDAAFAQFELNGRYYALCDSETLACYLPGVKKPTQEDCGAEQGTASFQYGSFPAYACAAFAGADPAPLLIVDRGGLFAYELAGFSSLGEHPDISAVCAAYGIGSGADLQAVGVRDADGTLLDTITRQEDHDAFYAKLSALGDDIGADGMAQACYDAYVQEYGEDERVTVADGQVQITDDELYEKAMNLWGSGICLVDIRTKTGLQIRRAVYAPVTGVFSVYGDYRITVPFFQ